MGRQEQCNRKQVKDFASEPIDRMQAPSVLKLKDVSFSYDGQTENIRSVSFTVNQGQWVSIAGSNGSGKSTLSRLLNGLLFPNEGYVEVAGLELVPEHLAAIRRKIGMVFQNPDNQFVGSTVEEDIAFGLEGLRMSRKEMWERIHRYAEQFGVGHLLSKHPSELSGGQKQRVALASVLAMEPEIVVLDEASSMLDEQARGDLIRILKQMHEQGRYTILSITHDADEIKASERVLVMRAGEVIADVSPSELFADKELMSQSSLEAPFSQKLAEELKSRGLMLERSGHERELVNFLWSFN
ncbi:energy-coupling factor transporter ATPase [Paenibacillus dakarensis]|uniref:energy-coupling factor transporter ATPase n=1 Tax=Paenibacillus dakarensis TaxID=1527293 RepID=UPI000A891A09|nr:energy-coupling factor transporter ATPase [Paenibacillus dakarensis]